MAGLAIGIASMRSGEQALLHVGWELGYGKEGSFSFPNVPPMADLIYEVELIGFDEAKEGKARSDMTVEERIAAAERRKVEGNDYFKEEKLEEAMQQYEMAIAYMGDDFMFQLFGKYRDMALAVKNPCHLNMAACLIKLKRYEEAIGQCTIPSTFAFTYCNSHQTNLVPQLTAFTCFRYYQKMRTMSKLFLDEERRDQNSVRLMQPRRTWRRQGNMPPKIRQLSKSFAC
ncbi:peptidyl-prolyl cis-trans isomerase FKBP42-like isoform X2 [Zingiber officinale]|uniref:peptidyl-prolyl cis-trans isomerase FKBP42-like isoform X2 n=1 Tax=Zingiber officinale TaxID=94328 RepID=UPI001C4C7699|nr:peptidyl-prolyl cis-trans isomerase FKBP42-like isoform X2 [Zingiber officinale]